MSDTVLLERHDSGVAVVTLNRPDAMNALSAELRSALCTQMQRIRDDDTVRAVVLTGAGNRAFTAGLDLKELGAGDDLSAANDQDPMSNPVTAIAECGKPVIGAINGVAITGGFELALACDILLASEQARFADTHALVGIMPGWGLSQKLPRIIGLSRAKEMSLSGRFISADTAAEWGLVNRVYPEDTLLSEAIALAEDIAFVEPGMLSRYRNLIDDGAKQTLASALTLEHRVSSEWNRQVSSEDVEARRLQVMARGRAQKR